MKKTLLVVCTGVLIAAFLFQNHFSVNDAESELSRHHSSQSKLVNTSKNATGLSTPELFKESKHKDHQHDVSQDKSHIDYMSPEIKQALRDKLLFNAPIETEARSDGSVIMKTNGRVTHMPVAIQMPDGTIKIKEYSYIPEDK